MNYSVHFLKDEKTSYKRVEVNQTEYEINLDDDIIGVQSFYKTEISLPDIKSSTGRKYIVVDEYGVSGEYPIHISCPSGTFASLLSDEVVEMKGDKSLTFYNDGEKWYYY